MSNTHKISRREMLKLMGGAAAGAAVAHGIPRAASASSYRRAAKSRLVIMSSTDPAQVQPLIQAIEAANQDMVVDWRNLTSERYVELFSASDLAGEQIDLMDMNGQDLRRYATAGKLMDLTDQVKYLDRFQPVAVQTYNIGGKQWALPRGGIDGFTFLYNKKLLDKVGMKDEPTTYDDLLKLQPELKKLGAAVFTHQGKNIYLWPVWQFWAFAQTSGNKAIEMTIKTLQGDMKFTDPMHVAALEILYKFTQDKMFIDNVLGLDADTEATFFQSKALFWYWGPWEIAAWRKAKKPADGSKDQAPDLDLSLMPPVLAVSDKSIKRQLPGGVGSALGMYVKIASERKDVALKVMDLMTSDKWIKWENDTNSRPVSSNKNVVASEDPVALKYAKDCAPNQFTYLDWLWPPEITKAFQLNQQAIVAGTMKPDAAAASIQKAFDQLVQDGYEFGK
jgi:raffinose/stachyose/melibiose transport system substrate-binding protein